MPLVTLTQDNRATTTSLAVAEKFGKNHRDVLRAIRNLECSPEFLERNFAQLIGIYTAGKGAQREQQMYEITRDGFAFLAMGFTGPEAAKWKEQFLAAFNALESAWLAAPSAQFAARELRVRDRAARFPVIKSYVDGLLSFPAQAYGLALGFAEEAAAQAERDPASANVVPCVAYVPRRRRRSPKAKK
jgi:Rha family phage regulatory protein